MDCFHPLLAYRHLVSPQVFTDAAPFNDRAPQEAMEAIIGGDRPPRPTHSTFTDELWVLMQRCWHQDPQARPRASELLGGLRVLSFSVAMHSLTSLFSRK